MSVGKSIYFKRTLMLCKFKNNKVSVFYHLHNQTWTPFCGGFKLKQRSVGCPITIIPPLQWTYVTWQVGFVLQKFQSWARSMLHFLPSPLAQHFQVMWKWTVREEVPTYLCFLFSMHLRFLLSSEIGCNSIVTVGSQEDWW